MVLSSSLTLYILIGIIIILALVIIRLEMRMKKLFRGKKGGDLEETLNTILASLEKVRTTQKSLTDHLVEVDHRLGKGIRSIETIRFNPFKDQGSNQSFATALLNDEGDGLILSSLYSRERVSIFAKPIKNNASQFDLTTEEKEVLQKAKRG